jgi:hypothetical protein
MKMKSIVAIRPLHGTMRVVTKLPTIVCHSLSVCDYKIPAEPLQLIAQQMQLFTDEMAGLRGLFGREVSLVMPTEFDVSLARFFTRDGSDQLQRGTFSGCVACCVSWVDVSSEYAAYVHVQLLEVQLFEDGAACVCLSAPEHDCVLDEGGAGAGDRQGSPAAGSPQRPASPGDAAAAEPSEHADP